jgi:hypothetical protein
MDEFLNPFWNLDQIFGWAETRDSQLVRAAAWPRYGRPKPTLQIGIRSTHAATTLLRDGRDIGGELWVASGWMPALKAFDPPSLIRAYADKHGVPAYRAYLHKDLRIDEPLEPAASALITAWKLASEPDRELLGVLVHQHTSDRAAILGDGKLSKLPEGLADALKAFLSRPEVQGPPRVYFREPFPTLNCLEFLFRLGRLTATGMLPGDPRSVDISPADWGGLGLGVGGEFERMAVWREGRLSRTGEGEFENVRVAREQVLREFPAEAPAASVAPSFQPSPPTGVPPSQPSRPTDDEILGVIRIACGENDGFISQAEGVRIVQAQFPLADRTRIRALVKLVTGTEKAGPKGPRKIAPRNRAE